MGNATVEAGRGCPFRQGKVLEVDEDGQGSIDVLAYYMLWGKLPTLPTLPTCRDKNGLLLAGAVGRLNARENANSANWPAYAARIVRRLSVISFSAMDLLRICRLNERPRKRRS
ncbi:MAG: hypothetical protein L0Y71_06805 [Gemmataceae bacterium]|nr:hypothetical protein [Gemmataceae bacterium]